MANETLLHNVSQAIGNSFKDVIGTSNNTNIGMYVVGIILLVIFIYWIFSSGIGIWGLIVILPPLILVISYIPGQESKSLGLLPAWVGAIVWLMVGAIWGLILLRFFREG